MAPVIGQGSGKMLEKIIEVQAGMVPGPCGPLARTPRLELALVVPSHPDRANAESFVRAVFSRAYGARLNAFYPLLMSIAWRGGEYAAVAGVRPAGNGRLFSEHYLDDAADSVLGVDRRRIVEIGNLAPAGAGQARWLICTLTAFLAGAGFTHVVFTAVPKLQNAFQRMGLPLTKLADARSERLPPDQLDDWGTYYESRPAVYSGDVRVGRRAFRSILATDPGLREIARHAFVAGQSFSNNHAPGADERDYPFA